MITLFQKYMLKLRISMYNMAYCLHKMIQITIHVITLLNTLADILGITNFIYPLNYYCIFALVYTSNPAKGCANDMRAHRMKLE